MTVVLINPNSTETMTEAALAAARAATPDLALAGWTSRHGPPAIEGAADGELAVSPLLDLVAKADAEGADGIIIACFDDTGLAEARRLARCPVIGIGQAAFATATLCGDSFSVVTTTPASVPVIEANISAQGFGHALRRVISAEIAVLHIETRPQHSQARIAAAVRAALDDGPRAIVLGCAGMVRVVERIRRECPVPVIEGVTAAACLMAALRSSTGRSVRT